MLTGAGQRMQAPVSIFRFPGQHITAPVSIIQIIEIVRGSFVKILLAFSYLCVHMYHKAVILFPQGAPS